MRLGYNQTDFAGLVGASKRSQIGWEQGRSNPDGAAYEAWAKIGLDVTYVFTGQRSAAGTVSATAELPPGEQLLLEAYRDLPVAKQKQLLADLLVGNAGKKAARKTGTSINVTGDGNRTAGRNYNENTKEK